MFPSSINVKSLRNIPTCGIAGSAEFNEFRKFMEFFCGANKTEKISNISIREGWTRAQVCFSRKTGVLFKPQKILYRLQGTLVEIMAFPSNAQPMLQDSRTVFCGCWRYNGIGYMTSQGVEALNHMTNIWGKYFAILVTESLLCSFEMFYFLKFAKSARVICLAISLGER